MNYLLIPAQIQRLQKLRVGLVYLFGSYAEGKNQTLSDVDIGVIFLDELSLRGDCSKIYNELYDVFTDVFPDKSVDIIFLQKAGLELCFDAVVHGEILYESSREARFEFEERISILYADFKPLLDEFNRAILNRI